MAGASGYTTFGRGRRFLLVPYVKIKCRNRRHLGHGNHVGFATICTTQWRLFRWSLLGRDVAQLAAFGRYHWTDSAFKRCYGLPHLGAGSLFWFDIMASQASLHASKPKPQCRKLNLHRPALKPSLA